MLPKQVSFCCRSYGLWRSKWVFKGHCPATRDVANMTLKGSNIIAQGEALWLLHDDKSRPERPKFFETPIGKWRPFRAIFLPVLITGLCPVLWYPTLSGFFLRCLFYAILSRLMYSPIYNAITTNPLAINHWKRSISISFDMKKARK